MKLDRGCIEVGWGLYKIGMVLNDWAVGWVQCQRARMGIISDTTIPEQN
jgi:hypothetical protein